MPDLGYELGLIRVRVCIFMKKLNCSLRSRVTKYFLRSIKFSEIII